MTAGWTDAHCHLQEFAGSGELGQVTARAEIFNIQRFLVSGTQPKDWEAVALLNLQHPHMIPQFGLHPWFADHPQPWEALLREMLVRFPRAGLGEIGLDKQLTETPFDRQREVFRQQLDLSRELQRPCTVHAVGPVWDELLEDVQGAKPRAVLLHAWGGGTHQLARWIEANAWFSFGGSVCRTPLSASLRQTLEAVPADRLLLETDSPWQHPRGKDHRQEPAALLAVAEVVSRVKGIPLDTLREVTEKNVERCFGLSGG